MEVQVVRYKDFKEKLKLMKEYKKYRVEDLGNGVMMLSKRIRLI